MKFYRGYKNKKLFNTDAWIAKKQNTTYKKILLDLWVM